MSATWQICETWREPLAAAGVASLAPLLDETTPDQTLPGQLQRLTKPGLGGRERWRWLLEVGGASRTFYLKRYRRSDWRAQWDRLWRQTFGHSRGWWEYEVSRRLEAAHVPAPAPIAFAEEMFGQLERSSAVVMAGVAGDAFERRWQTALGSAAPITRGRLRHDLTRRLARFIAAFHGTGICHRDLYLSHVFVEWDEHCQQPPRFTLIDLARAHRPRWRPRRWLLKDLAQLDYSARQLGASRSDRLRFLLHYLGLQPRAPRTRWYARRIVHRSDRIHAREVRKGRAR